MDTKPSQKIVHLNWSYHLLLTTFFFCNLLFLIIALQIQMQLKVHCSIYMRVFSINIYLIGEI